MNEYSIAAIKLLTLLRERSKTNQNYATSRELRNVIDMKEDFDIVLAELKDLEQVRVISIRTGKAYQITDKGLLRLRDAYKELTPAPKMKQTDQLFNNVIVKENYGTIGHSSVSSNRDVIINPKKQKTTTIASMIKWLFLIIGAIAAIISIIQYLILTSVK